MKPTLSNPNAPTRLRLHIDRVRLPYRQAARRRQMADALRQELTRLFSNPAGTFTLSSRNQRVVKMPSLKHTQRPEPERLGRQVARQIYRQCTRGGAS